MLKIRSNKKNYKTIISLTIIGIGISFMFWALTNIKSYDGYNVETKMTMNVINNEVETVLKYKPYPSKGDYIGTISLPTLAKTFPIYEGTSSAELKKGVGHFIESVLPGIKNNSVLSAHRDTHFKEIRKLEIGDRIVINMDIEEFVYEINNVRIVHKSDKTVIVPTEEAVLTLTTCYPFNYIGVTSKRYIVSAVLIDAD